MDASQDFDFEQRLPHPVAIDSVHPSQWQWTTVTLSLDPPPSSPPGTGGSCCSHPQHPQQQVNQDHGQVDEDEQLARILAAQWDAELPAPFSSSSAASSSSSSAASVPSSFSPSTATATDTEYAQLAHLPAAQVFADEGPLFNLHARFQYYNARHFHSLLSACEARWSTRMTLCAGQCHYQPASGYCSIRLSHPLLQFRPKQDCINTLLHEMIHAYLFITDGNDNHDGHGPAFHEWMRKLNKLEHGANITVFHTFKDEVNEQRQHVWQCNGPCKDLPPFFGIVRRAMNRPPQKADWWFEKHAKECGGTHDKIAGPEPKAKAASKRRKDKVEEDGGGKAVKKRKVKEERSKGKLDGYLVKEGGGSRALEPSLSAAAGEVVDLTLDRSSETEVGGMDLDDVDDIILVRDSNP